MWGALIRVGIRVAVRVVKIPALRSGVKFVSEQVVSAFIGGTVKKKFKDAEKKEKVKQKRPDPALKKEIKDVKRNSRNIKDKRTFY